MGKELGALQHQAITWSNADLLARDDPEHVRVYNYISN